MSPLPRHAVVLVALGAFLQFADSVRADKPAKAEIAKLGKAATAFVDVPAHGTGTAFCVHPSGLFVTNEHVVRGKDKAEVKLVIDASLNTQRVLTATIVRADKDLDLALLRASTTAELPSLALGSDVGLTELMDVVAFGFPLGAALSADRKDYPAMSVNAGNVSALRRKGGELSRIQIDVSVTFGSSGGPVLDENGKVIGVVVSGVPGQRGMNLAIPVSHVSRFLNAPDIQFTPPELTRASLEIPVEFKAKSVSVVPGAKEPTLRLVLRAGDQEAREFPMTKREGAHVATAVPVAKENNGRVEITVRLGSGSVSGITANTVLRVGDKPMRLSSVRRIELKPKSAVLLADGKTLEGEITGLGTAEILVGDDKIKLDLRKAVQIQVQPAAEVAVVTATIIASLDGKEVGRSEVPIPVREIVQINSADPSSVVITPPALGDEKVVKRLPEPFSEVCLGGGGRFLIFHLPRVKKLAVFDLNEARITNYIPLPEDKVAFAAGLDKLVIGLPGKGALERWSLTTFERETTVYPTLKDEIKMVLMGHGSNGPVVVNGAFMDLATLQPMNVTFEKGGWDPGTRLFPSGDGTVFGIWGDHAVAFVLEGNQVKRYEAGFGRHVIPGPDGSRIFTVVGVFTANLGRADPEDEKLGYCLPAVRGSFFLSLTSGDGSKGGGVTVYLQGHPRPVARPKLEHGIYFDGTDNSTELGPWRRIYLVPDANLIAVLPSSNDQVVLHKLDLDLALDKSGLEYLFVVSHPPRSVRAGSMFTYKVQVKSKNPPATYRLETGPKGMAVSKDGVVSWNVPADAAGDQDVIMTVKDSKGQEIFHNFALRIVK